MFYEINVSLNGKHLFATAERSATNTDKARELYFLFTEKFPEKDGYKVTVSKWEKFGHNVYFDN